MRRSQRRPQRRPTSRSSRSSRRSCATKEQLQRHGRAVRDLHRGAASASNEELQAINEELRSATEELETSKEELQSINEELMTVNQELKNKVEETRKVNDDLQNLIGLDRHRHGLRRPRPAHQALHAARDAALQPDPSRHRPPAARHHAPPRLRQLADDAAEVFETLRPIEREVRSSDGRWYLARVLPYRTHRGPHRRRGADLRRHHRARAGRGAAARRRGAAAAGGREHARTTPSSRSTPRAASRAGTRAPSGCSATPRPRWSASRSTLLFTPEDRADGVPQSASCAARARTGRADDERWHLRKDGSRVLLQRHHRRRCTRRRAAAASRRSRAT